MWVIFIEVGLLLVLAVGIAWVAIPRKIKPPKNKKQKR